MAPNKKKKKPTSNPARGFATVSTPSKKAIDDDVLEVQDRPEESSVNGRLVDVQTRQNNQVASERQASNLQHCQDMGPDELEHHLEDAELQSLLNVHAQRCKKDMTRQIARLETERRSLRGGGIMLETESWLREVQDEILELARSFSPDHEASKTDEYQPDDPSLCVRLWTIQQTLLSLRFGDVDNVLRHLAKTMYVNSKIESNTLTLGLDEAINWLALRSDLGDLPAYQQPANPQYTPPASRDRSPGFDYASGETTDASSFAVTRSCSYLPSIDETDSGSSSAMPKSHTRNEASDLNFTEPISDGSDDDDDDPDKLVDKFLSAKYELLKASMSSEESQQGFQATAQRLTRRIEMIERDVLFDRDEAMARWDDVGKDLEIGYARSSALARRRKAPGETPTFADDCDAPVEPRKYDSSLNDDGIGEGLFGSMFASDETTNGVNEAAATVTINVRDFGPVGAGGNSRKVLEDICKVR